ncbi:MAG: helix-turn-helix transcriptional regulator [Ruminococcaceae bacterium]|nr:helix-turn-helix transcriptional regulator [Oscillospiraceae bacterium]
MDFNEKLQKLRKDKGITQEELAEILFVSRTAVSKWETGRGYPNLESLKAIANFFNVSIDDLLSGDEVITIAEQDSKQKESDFIRRIFALLDCGMIAFLFLPLFGQSKDEIVQSLSLFSLTNIQPYLRAAYYIIVIAIILWGILALAIKTDRKTEQVSIVLSMAGAMLFILSRQPYAAAMLLIFLAIKAFLLIKTR